MKRTNEQVVKFVKNTLNKYDIESEDFQTKMYNYWYKYDLTEQQVKFLDEVRRELSGPTEFNIMLERGLF